MGNDQSVATITKIDNALKKTAKAKAKG